MWGEKLEFFINNSLSQVGDRYPKKVSRRAPVHLPIGAL